MHAHFKPYIDFLFDVAAFDDISFSPSLFTDIISAGKQFQSSRLRRRAPDFIHYYETHIAAPRFYSRRMPQRPIFEYIAFELSCQARCYHYF